MHAPLNKEIAKTPKKCFLKEWAYKIALFVLKSYRTPFHETCDDSSYSSFLQCHWCWPLFCNFFAISGLTSYQNILLIV